MRKKAKVLIVDNLKANRKLLHEMMLILGHEPLSAENGLSALDLVREQCPDLVLLDIKMPEMDGFQVLERMMSDSVSRHIPVIMISGIDDMGSIVRCIEEGATDYLAKPFNQTLLKARINASLEKKRLHDEKEELLKQIEDNNRQLEDRIREQVREFSLAQLGTIFAISKLAESRDPETGEHLERMREYCKLLAIQLGRQQKYSSKINDRFVDNLYAAAPLHDIGKIGIPDHILQKPGKLTNEEHVIIETHAIIGSETLRVVDRKYTGNAFIQMGVDIAESHHEKWDGSGYPHGLAGDEIPLVGRILAVGDVYDALTSKRCYKEAYSHNKSREVIISDKGKHFDPEVVDAFIATEPEFINIREHYADSSIKRIIG